MNNPVQLKRYKRIMMIDDDEVDTYISNRIINSASIADDIVMKSSISDALSYLNSLNDKPDELPEIIFLDLGLPGMDGYDFLDEFKMLKDVVKIRCKIVVLTGTMHPDPNKLKTIKNNPFIKCIINKPLTVEALGKI